MNRGTSITSTPAAAQVVREDELLQVGLSNEKYPPTTRRASASVVGQKTPPVKMMMRTLQDSGVGLLSAVGGHNLKQNRIKLWTEDALFIAIGLLWRVCLFVGCLLNVPATCECISGTDLLRQFLRAATLRYKLQIKLSISPSHSTVCIAYNETGYNRICL